MFERSQKKTQKMTLLSFHKYIESTNPHQICFLTSEQDEFIDNAIDAELCFSKIFISVGQKYIRLDGECGNIIFRSVLYVCLFDSESYVKAKIICQRVLENTNLEYKVIIK